MGKLKYLLYKDFLLLIRDKAGLSMMFLMPMLLVVIMTYLQDSTFNSIQETRIPLLLLNNDTDSLGTTIERQIEASNIFKISKRIDNKTPLTKEALKNAVAKGDFMIGIVIPENATLNIRKNVKRYILNVFNGSTPPSTADSVQIDIFIDPVTKNSFRTTLMSTLREYAVRTESDFIFKEITGEVNKLSPIPISDIQPSHNQVIFNEQYATLSDSDKIPNSVQHNVPAWGMFAIFFITISLAGNIIKEREDGSYTRLRTMPFAYSLYLLSKVVVYLTICMLQLLTLLLIGKFIFPLLDLPVLNLGHQYVGLLLMAVSSALAAIGYGIAIGKIATSHQQASIFASISVVIMAAVGGVWIPVFIMPHAMQMLSHISPLNWGLEGFYDLLVRDGSWVSVLPEAGILLLFFVLCTGFAILYNKRKRIDL